MRRLVRATLDANGLELREAADGKEALAAIAEARPDAIVLDLVMPELDGFGLLEVLQADRQLRSIPVVVLTARSLSAADRSRLQAGAVALLEKSAYSAAELRRLIELALGASVRPRARADA